MPEKPGYEELVKRVRELEHAEYERGQAQQALKKIEWMLSGEGSASSAEGPESKPYIPPYGDLTRLNTCRVILDSVGAEALETIVSDYLDLLDTSVAVYEKNGDYALGIFSSQWCRFMDQASYRLCAAQNAEEALASGRWICHESCWSQAARQAIDTGEAADIACEGGIRLYAVPITASGEIIGTINVGYGDPPTDRASLERLASKYRVSVDELVEHSNAYESRPAFVIDLAKRRIHASARLIGEIVERRQAEKALKESEDKYRTLYENAPLSYQSLDRDGNFLDVNPAWLQTLGYERAEVIGRNFAEFLHPEWKPHFEVNFPGFKQRGYVHDVQFKIRHKDGRYLDISFEGCIGYWPDGSFRQTYCVFKDITEQKRMERELIHRNQFIETILDNLPIGLAVNYINEGKATYMNKKFEDIFGWPSEELVDIDAFFEKVYPDPEYRAHIKRMVFNDIASGDPQNMVWEGIEVTGRDGRKKIITAKNIPLYEQNLMISTVQDITESKRLQKQLQQAQKMEAIGTLAGGIAHDFNNILSSVIGYTELCLDQLAGGSLLHSNLSEVLVAGMRARDLVRQILTLSRRDEHEKKPVPVVSLVKEALKMLRSTTPTSIAFEEDVSEQDLIINADPTQIHQVIMNLATNAVHAMAEMEGRLEVSVQPIRFEERIDPHYIDIRPGRYVRIAVSDTGTGIPEADREKIFEPYFTTKDKGRGTGLGLSVVHGIVKSHDGHISVYSEPGEGTTFHVYLPLAEIGAAALPDQHPEPLPAGNEHILLVDDELPIVKMHQQSLERLGYQTSARTSSADALEVFQASPGTFDLVLTDMTMPQMTGDKLARAIKRIRPGIPVILCTGYSERLRESGTELAIDGILMKPIDKKTMAEAVRKLLDERKSG